eukprot:3715419-Amphidinium_carterae.1
MFEHSERYNEVHRRCMRSQEEAADAIVSLREEVATYQSQAARELEQAEVFRTEARSSADAMSNVRRELDAHLRQTQRAVEQRDALQ